LVVGGSMSAVLYIQAVQDNSEYDSIWWENWKQLNETVSYFVS
jgi:hypothetical protein